MNVNKLFSCRLQCVTNFNWCYMVFIIFLSECQLIGVARCIFLLHQLNLMHKRWSIKYRVAKERLNDIDKFQFSLQLLRTSELLWYIAPKLCFWTALYLDICREWYRQKQLDIQCTNLCLKESMCVFFAREAVAEYVKSKTASGMSSWFTIDFHASYALFGICHGRVSVSMCLSVCRKLVFY